MQKDTDNNIKTSNNKRMIGDTRDLAQSSLLSSLISERELVLELEETEMSLIINNKSLSGVVEIKDDLVGELTDRVAVSREDRVVLKAALRQLQREMRDDPPRE